MTIGKADLAGYIRGSLQLSKRHIMTDSSAPTSLDQPPKDRLSKLRSLYGFLGNYKLQAGLAALFLIISSISVLVIPSALGDIIDEGFLEAGTTDVDYYFGVFLAIVLVLSLSTALRFYFITWLGERVVADIRSAVYERLVTLSPAYFDSNRPGEIVSRLTADTTLVQSIVGSSISIWARNLLVAIGGTIWLFHMSPKLMGLISLLIPALLILIIAVGRRVRSLSRTSQDRVADVGAKANESLSALNVVQAFTREAEESRRFGSQVEKAFDVAKLRILVRALLTFLIMFLVLSAIAGIIYYGVQDVMSGAMSRGDLAEFILRAMIVAGSFAALSEIYSDLQRAAGAAGRLGELLNAKSPIAAPELPRQLPTPFKPEIQFDHITFAYPTRPHEKALDDFSLNISPGETVALVGPSGAGKSTVLQLILRFYDPNFGDLRVAGRNLTDIDPVAYRDHLSLVPQETVIFADTVSENIRYGRLDADMDEIKEAAKAAAALEFIESHPDGFDAQLGERGTRLSGGQRQRIAIARAILRDAPILLLDEATSALDAESEHLVKEALERTMQGRTTVVIAHRLSTVQQADRIIVMDKGQIVAEGTHTDLMQQDGLYRRLARLQFGAE